MAMWNNQRVSLSCAVRIYPNTWKIPCHQTSMTCPSPSTGFQHSLHSFSPTCRKVPQTILCTQAQHAMFHAVSLAEQREKGIKKPTKAVETPPFLAHGPMDFHGVYWCFVCLLEGNWWQPGSQNPHEGFCQLIAFPLRQKIGGSSKKYPSGEQSIYIYIPTTQRLSNFTLFFCHFPGGNIHVFMFQSWARRSLTCVWANHSNSQTWFKAEFALRWKSLMLA